MLRRLCLVLALAALPAAAESPVRPADADRLAGFEAAFGRAVKQALAGGGPEELAVLAEAMAGAPSVVAPEGAWSCRTLKLGGLGPLVVYPAFLCRIARVGPNRWRIDKLTGSQRLEGTIEAGPDRTLYRGVGFVDGGPAVGYDGMPPEDQSPVEPGQTVAQVGLYEQMGPDRARLLLPAPLLESDFDILYLTR